MSKNYAITRVKKYSHVSQVSYLVNHHLRLVDVPNADPARAKKNEILVQKNVMEFLNEVPKGSKKNACRFVDCLFTASHFENAEHERQWQKSTVDFIKKEFGEENLALVVVHNDEKTKHVHVIFKPVNPKTGKLGAGHWFDGRMKMKAYQERYFQAVKHLKFERGDPNKRAHHTTIKEHYAQVNKSAAEAEKEVASFKKSLVTLHNEVKNFSLVDVFRPAKFFDRIKPHFGRVYKKSKEVFKYQAYNRVAEKEERDLRLAEENANLRHKLETLTGKENPNWVEVNNLSEVLTAEAERRTEVLPKNGVGVGVAPAIQSPTADRIPRKKKL
jgi:uncharacterized protein YeaC (DUF1315 family)